MRYEIKKLHRDLGATSIYVTHDQIEAMTMADRIVAMNEGVAQQVGPPSELYDDPANVFVAGFIGSPAMNFLDATATREGDVATVRVGDIVLAEVEAPAGMTSGSRVTVGLRPERVRLGPPGTGAAALVDLVEPTGLGAVVHLMLGGQALKLFTTERLMPKTGESVGLSVSRSDLLLFDPASGIRLRSRPHTPQ